MRNVLFTEHCFKSMKNTICCYSWPFLGRSWPLLGRSWSLSGCSWPLLGRSWAALGVLLGLLGAVLGFRSLSNRIFDRFGSQLGRLLGPLGEPFSPCTCMRVSKLEAFLKSVKKSEKSRKRGPRTRKIQNPESPKPFPGHM